RNVISADRCPVESEPAGRSPAPDQARLRRGESRNLFLNRFLHSAPVLSAKAETGTSVEMTAGLFYRANLI
ncbi:MAG: hypothetical protein NTX52_12385, partial [Planctomycetota bacterium]|nr:hypothetical protein [Planctomycetota bacterium]